MDSNTIKKLAHLSCLELTDQETNTLSQQMTGILAWIDQLRECPTEGISPIEAAGSPQAFLREDNVSAVVSPDILLNQAPQRDRNFFVVPKVVDSGA